LPELPEVEVTRRHIEPLLVGRTIARVWTSAPSYLFLTDPAVLRRRLAGRRGERLDRLGKYLVLALDGGSRLVLHLGMTG
jgi:formamidopyrimidine-DNA glycosylase